MPDFTYFYKIHTMEYFLLLALCSAISLNTAQILPNSVEEHYWRDYRGLVPDDALVAGKNKNGQNTFIGQMNIRVPDYASDKNRTIDFVPAVVTYGSKTVIGIYNAGPITSNDSSNVKILCTRYASRYSWHNESTGVPTGCRYVVVGLEDSVLLYVGRGTHQNQILHGKVYSNDRYGKYAFIPYEGIKLLLYDYTTLMYCY